MSDEENVIISCLVCGATADYDTPCPNGCDPLTHYLVEETSINISEENFDALMSVTLNEVIEIVNSYLKKVD